MSKTTLINNNEETDIDDIDPSELIDTQENKPKITQHEDLNDSVEPTPKTSPYKRIEFKQVSKLTEDEKNYLIDLYRNGGEDEYYKVYFYKNGTNKIVKRKQPPKYNTAKRLLEQQQQQAKPVMTTEQILMEHVIDLEAKYATLYQKHKRLKKNYKSLHEDIYCDEDDEAININQVQQASKAMTTNNQVEEPTQETPEEAPITTMPTNSDQQEFQNNYMSKIRRPQKGYRRMMASMY